MSDAVQHYDLHSTLHCGGSLQTRLEAAHAMFDVQCPGIARIGVALFDEASGQVRSFLASQEELNPLQNYQVALKNTSSLAASAQPGRARIINDLRSLHIGSSEHGQKIRALGMRSSYTLPVYDRSRLLGFVFLDSRQKDFFDATTLPQVDLFAQLVAQLVVNYQAGVRTLMAALRVSTSMMHLKDPETGNHLERMARFARLIAEQLVRRGQAQLTDEQIDNLYRFAPLHDIGKVGIPDRILLKPAPLDAEEWSVMKSHSGIGRSIVDRLIGEFDCDYLPDLELLRHIVELHHEKIDGSGYPHGLAGQQIPLAAKLISVSDIFDALTNERPYKPAWTNQQALAELRSLAERGCADRLCVAALQDSLPEVTAIQRQFADR